MKFFIDTADIDDFIAILQGFAAQAQTQPIPEPATALLLLRIVAAIGRHVCEVWKLPSPIPEVIGLHHQPARAYERQDAVAPMVALLRIADHYYQVHHVDDRYTWAPIGEFEDVEAHLAEGMSHFVPTRIDPVSIPGIAYGNTFVRIVSHFVAPKARLPSRNDFGTASKFRRWVAGAWSKRISDPVHI